jgi:molybdopterin/thiamine biosynthesis adenylyltransferase
MVIGDRWITWASGQTPAASLELDRQSRAFGAASTIQIAGLKIGLVGCGGTGSAVASLLARVGVRKLALLDADVVEDTNLNRLHFATRVDASLRRQKVDVVGEGVAGIGLPVSVVRAAHFADRPEGLAILRSCDVVFGCTDDDLGREVLNRLAHFYFIPVIDLGLLIEPNVDGGYDTFDGRVTVVQPGYPCQSCRGLISEEQVYLDSLRRDPRLLELVAELAMCRLTRTRAPLSSPSQQRLPRWRSTNFPSAKRFPGRGPNLLRTRTAIPISKGLRHAAARSL